MSKPRKSRSVCASPQGKKLLEQTKIEVKDDQGNRLTYEKIGEIAKVSDKTVRRFFNGERTDKFSANAIIKVLDLEYNDVVSQEEEYIDNSIAKIAEHESNSSRASELITGLETILEEFRKDSENDYQAMEWLKLHRKDLAEQAAEVALRECDNQNLYDGDLEYMKIIQELSKDVKEYLRFCYICLKEGTIKVLEDARQQSLFPSNFDSVFYSKALLFIKDQKVSCDLTQEVGQNLVNCLLTLLLML